GAGQRAVRLPGVVHAANVAAGARLAGAVGPAVRVAAASLRLAAGSRLAPQARAAVEIGGALHARALGADPAAAVLVRLAGGRVAAEAALADAAGALVVRAAGHALAALAHVRPAAAGVVGALVRLLALPVDAGLAAPAVTAVQADHALPGVA